MVLKITNMEINIRKNRIKKATKFTFKYNLW